MSNDDKQIGTMVACLSCKNIVSARDMDLGDARAVLNVLQIPCRICGAIAWDGFNVRQSWVGRYPTKVNSTWELMREVAKANGFNWDSDASNSPAWELPQSIRI